MSATLSPADIVAVTVTYGSRLRCLQEVLAALVSQGVRTAVVVDNGCEWNVSEACSAIPELGVRIVRLERNCGSAGGYRAGMEAALLTSCEFLFLVDDDNAPEPDCISRLLSVYSDGIAADQRDSTALLAAREGHSPDLFDADGRERRTASEFLGFSLGAKIARRFGREAETPVLRGTRRDRYPRVATAPYGGLMLPRALVVEIGLPDPSFVLYADDTEFSYRITRLGRRILFVPHARIRDIETSWNLGAPMRTAARGWVLGTSDLRAYYSARNRAYFERHCRPCSAWRRVNEYVYMGLLLAVSLVHGRFTRWRVLARAVRDGHARRLGTAARFPLS